MSDSVQQIKDRLTIVDVVSLYVELHKAGKSYKGKSPFTNEKTPSFFVSPDRGMYYCFSTSQGGDMFTFVEKMEGVDFKGALKILAEKAGVELVPEDPKKKTERDRQYEVLREAAGFFVRELTNKPTALAYLKDRGVTPETIQKWQIGYAPGPPEHGWRDTKEFLITKEFTNVELQNAGLIKGGDTGKEPYDVFRDRVMFPIFDASRRVVAFSGRILTKDSDAPKYVNSPETELFNKSEILYGYHAAKNGIRNMDFSLIVEGQFDVVMTHQAGYGNAVAVSGTALTPHHVMLLGRLSNRVVLALDADRAGIAAVKRAADLMLQRGMDVKVAKMPDGKDPADIIHDDTQEFKTIIGHSTHVIEYLLDVLESSASDARAFKLKAREEILPFVAKIPNRIDQEHFEGVVAERLQTTKDAIHTEVDRWRERFEKEAVKTAASAQSASATIARSVTEEVPLQRLGALASYITAFYTLLTSAQVAAITEHLRDNGLISEATLQALISETETTKQQFVLESEVRAPLTLVQQEQLIDAVNQLHGLWLKKQLAEKRADLQNAATDKVEASVVTELTEIQKKLSVSALTREQVFGE